MMASLSGAHPLTLLPLTLDGIVELVVMTLSLFQDLRKHDGKSFRCRSNATLAFDTVQYC